MPVLGAVPVAELGAVLFIELLDELADGLVVVGLYVPVAVGV
jgi:hypothetical protein